MRFHRKSLYLLAIVDDTRFMFTYLFYMSLEIFIVFHICLRNCDLHFSVLFVCDGYDLFCICQVLF